MDNVVVGLVIPNAREPDDELFPDRADSRALMVVQICVSIMFAQILSRIFDILLSMRTSQFLLFSVAPFIRHSQLILKKFVVL